MSPNANGNGAPKSPYTRLADTDVAFATIEDTLNSLIANKAFEKQKAALVTYLEQASSTRHQVASLLLQKFANYEAGQLKKLTPPAATQ
jgi:rubrerythrin